MEAQTALDRLKRVGLLEDIKGRLSIAKDYVLRKTVIPVFLKALTHGIVSNVEVLDGISKLPTLLSRHIWIKNGDRVPQTVDYLTAIGIVGLVGDRETIFLDYIKIRSMESKLVFQ